MSDQASWSAFGKMAALVVGIPALLCIAAIAALLPLSPRDDDMRRGWAFPPFGMADVHQLENGVALSKFDDDSQFMLVAAGEMSADFIGAQRLFREDTLAPFVLAHSSEKGPWIIGTLDGRPSFVLELPHNFRVATSRSHSGYVITPTSNADGTITLKLTDPTR
jgi:hypothetical protein